MVKEKVQRCDGTCYNKIISYNKYSVSCHRKLQHLPYKNPVSRLNMTAKSLAHARMDVLKNKTLTEMQIKIA